MPSIIDETARAARVGTDQGLREVLDFLVTEEQLGVTFVSAAIERAKGTPSDAFVPVLRNAVTTEFHHVQALKKRVAHRSRRSTGSRTRHSEPAVSASSPRSKSWRRSRSACI